jgi:hypothetical protein
MPAIVSHRSAQPGFAPLQDCGAAARVPRARTVPLHSRRAPEPIEQVNRRGRSCLTSTPTGTSAWERRWQSGSAASRWRRAGVPRRTLRRAARQPRRVPAPRLAPQRPQRAHPRTGPRRGRRLAPRLQLHQAAPQRPRRRAHRPRRRAKRPTCALPRQYPAPLGPRRPLFSCVCSTRAPRSAVSRPARVRSQAAARHARGRPG